MRVSPAVNVDGVGEETRSAAPLQTLERALRLLYALADAPSPRTLQDLGRMVGSSASSVHRTLATLEEFGLVERELPSRRFRLGLGVLRLADARSRHLDIRVVARPHVEWLRDRTQETVCVSVLDGNEAVDVEREESPLELRQTIQIGRRIPLTSLGARSRVILAYLSEQEVETILAGVRWDDRPGGKDRFLADLARTRVRGTSRTYGERIQGAAAIAAAIRDHRGRPVAALLVAGPLFRFTDDAMDRAEADILRVAHDIERQLGYRSEEVNGTAVEGLAAGD